jgi:cystathionine gamma-synthase
MTKRKINDYTRATQALWAGEDEYLVERSTQVPIVQSVSYGYDDMDDMLEVALGQKTGHIYSRNTNPTLHAFEEKVRILERPPQVLPAAWPQSAIRCSRS